MSAPHSPIGSRRRLGAELRRLRTKAGLTLDEVAERMTCSTSKISRLETGKGIPKVPDVNELMRIYGVSSGTEREMLLRLVRTGREHGWWEQYTDGVHAERFVMKAPERYTAMESHARAVRTFSATVLHGLLQTRAYAEAVMRALLPDRDQAEIDRLVELRLERQHALSRAHGPLRLAVVLDESVLQREVGGVAVLAEQLAALLTVAERPNVALRVLPFARGMHRALLGPFVLLEFDDPGEPDVVFIESHAGDSYLQRPEDVEVYENVYSDAAERALDPDASRRLIQDYLRRLAPPERTPQ